MAPPVLSSRISTSRIAVKCCSSFSLSSLPSRGASEAYCLPTASSTEWRRLRSFCRPSGSAPSLENTKSYMAYGLVSLAIG